MTVVAGRFRGLSVVDPIPFSDAGELYLFLVGLAVVAAVAAHIRHRRRG